MSREEKIAMLKRQIATIRRSIEILVTESANPIRRLYKTLRKRQEELEKLEAEDGGL